LILATTPHRCLSLLSQPMVRGFEPNLHRARLVVTEQLHDLGNSEDNDMDETGYGLLPESAGKDEVEPGGANC
jgi:hypothetical protein